MLQSLREENGGGQMFQMLLSLRQNGLGSLFKEVSLAVGAYISWFFAVGAYISWFLRPKGIMQDHVK